MRCAMLFSTLLAFLAACGQPATETAELERLRGQVYFTKEDPGRWKDFAKDHDPQVKASSGKIEVDVPMSVEIGHYIEVILVSDAAGREVTAKTFKRGEQPYASLSIPLAKMAGATVTAKCNLHGMWRKAVGDTENAEIKN
jgi:desulfoferrodoxin (superoxide reductase-like protein)